MLLFGLFGYKIFWILYYTNGDFQLVFNVQVVVL